MAEQPQPPGQGGPEPGSIVQGAFPEGEDPIEVGLRELGEEQYKSVATAPESGRGGFGKIIGKLKEVVKPPSIPRPHLPKPHIPDISMPQVSMPDLSGVGEAIGQNRVGRFLKGSAESYLSKFSPKDKDVRAWVGGILGGAASVIAVAEAGATLGFSPVVRGAAVAATLNASDLLYSRLHRIYVERTLGGVASGLAPYLKEGVNRGELRKQIMDLEKRVDAKKLTGGGFVDEYKNELSQLLAPHLQDATHLNEQDRQVIAEQLVNKLVKLGRDYATVNKTARSLAAGMSAGSLVGALGEVGVRSILKGSVAQALLSQETIQLPRAEAPAPAVTPGGPAAVPEPVTPPVQPPIQPAEAPAEPVRPEVVTPPEAAPAQPPLTPAEAAPPPQPKLPEAVQQNLADIQKSPEYQVGIAAEVGKYLDARDDIVNSAMKTKDILPAEVDSASFDAGKEAALHVMEGKGNEIFENAAKEVLANNPDADLSQVTEAAQKAYAEWLASEAAQTQIAEAAQNAVADHLRIEDALAQKVTNGLAASPDWVKDVPLEQGATTGKILDLAWTPADAPVMGANIAANYDLLTDMWANMAKIQPDLLANGSFPVSLSELNDLVARAEAGDENAIKKLRQALHWIPAGSKFRAVAAGASREVLKLVA